MKAMKAIKKKAVLKAMKAMKEVVLKAMNDTMKKTTAEQGCQTDVLEFVVENKIELIPGHSLVLNEDGNLQCTDGIWFSISDAHGIWSVSPGILGASRRWWNS